MYNRYVPQSDGSFRRNRMQDAPEPKPPVQEPPKHQQESPPPCPAPQEKQSVRPTVCPPRQQPKRRKQEPLSGSAAGFLRQLLPKDFDTGDLLVVLLLLLMGGDCAEDQNTALLTLALYLFL